MVAGGRPEFPPPGTVQWEQFNQRRWELIQKHSRGTLATTEHDELAWLQRESLAAVNRTFLPPPSKLAAIRELEARLRARHEPETS